MMLPRSGYTLPVFACASAIAALRYLQQDQIEDTVTLNLVQPDEIAQIPVEQVARIGDNTALGITRNDPGDNLDITRHTPVWALVELKSTEESAQIVLKGGEGIGKLIHHEGEAAIYRYAQILLETNLQPLLKPTEQIIVTFILPEGRQLAKRTSNEAFGVVEGLSLLGTGGISQPLSITEQLELYQEELTEKAKQFETLVFCIGENGRDFAQKMGINSAQLVKTANWLGPMLVSAGLAGVKNVLLLGYHGKLIKLAGGIFHTHHYFADGRLEILTAHLGRLGLSNEGLQRVFNSPTTEDALSYLRELDQVYGSHWVEQVYHAIASTIDHRCQEYIRKLADREVCVGSVLFGRDRSIIIKSDHGIKLLTDSVREIPERARAKFEGTLRAPSEGKHGQDLGSRS